MDIIVFLVILFVIAMISAAAYGIWSGLKEGNSETDNSFENPYTDGLELFDYIVCDKNDLPSISFPGVAKRENEIIHYACPVKTFKDKEQVVGYAGRSSGFSVKVAKGIYYRTGGNKGTPIRSNVRTYINGTLVVTNQRIIFICEVNGFDVNFNKVTSLAIDNDIFSIQIGSKMHKIVIPVAETLILKEVIETASKPDKKQTEKTVKYSENEILKKAVDILLTNNILKASTLQRKLKLSYSEASNIICKLEKDGIISSELDENRGKLLLTEDELLNYYTDLAIHE